MFARPPVLWTWLQEENKMKLTSKPLAIIIVVILFGSIGITTALGWWSTESLKQAATFTEGEFAGQPNPADIRGSYTFGDIEKNFDVPAADLAIAFGLPEGSDAAAYSVKSLEEVYANLEGGIEVGTSSIRLFTAWYTGLPFEITDEIFLPRPAVELLKAKGSLTTEQLAYLDTHTVELPAFMPAVEGTPAPVIEETPIQSETARTIKGKTIFGEVLDWGVSQEVIETILGTPMPDRLIKIKDYCTEKGLDFETIKTNLQVEIDKLPAP
jgi:hypothetical protein